MIFCVPVLALLVLTPAVHVDGVVSPVGGVLFAAILGGVDELLLVALCGEVCLKLTWDVRRCNILFSGHHLLIFF